MQRDHGGKDRPINNDDEGFTLIEVLVATVVFAILATAFALTLSGSLGSFRASKARTVAEQVASSQLEDARRMAYDDLGTVGGNPPGILAATRTVTNAGQVLNVATHVSYVNDPIPNAVETGANYKAVRVTVTLAGSSNPLAHMLTMVAPPADASLLKGLIKVRVIDYALNEPLSGAVVNLGSGPDSPLSDATDAAGYVSFAALEPTTASGPTSKYDLTVSAPGYQTLPEDLPPAPAARTSLAAGQVFTTALRVFKPVTLNVHLRTSLGLPYMGPATITVSSSRGAGTVATTSADTSITQVNGAPLVPSVSYTVGATAPLGTFSNAVTLVVPSNYPTVLTSDVTLTMNTYVDAGHILVQLRDAAGGPIVGSTVVLIGGPASIAVSAVSNNGGVADIDVPAGEVPDYLVFVPAQAGYGQATTTAAGPKGQETIPVTLTLTIPTP